MDEDGTEGSCEENRTLRLQNALPSLTLSTNTGEAGHMDVFAISVCEKTE